MKAKEDASVTALLKKHFTALNDLDLEKRRALFAEVYHPHIILIDPHGIADGPRELEKFYDGIHARFPGYVFRVVDDIEVHHECARVHWELAKSGASDKHAGDDFVRLKEGRIVEIIVFITGQTKRPPSNHGDR